jgi:hypothetical protein
MKTCKNKLIFSVLLWMIALPFLTFGQGGLVGSWKYAYPGGEMIMQITSATITINGQTFQYKAEGNNLMINEGNAITPYPYMLSGNELYIEFPGGTELAFTRGADNIQPQGQSSQSQLPMSMTKPSSGAGQGQQGSGLSGRWIFQNQQGQLVLEFISANQLSFNGEIIQYQLKEGIIQVMADYGWIDYPYALNQGTLTITFPDGGRYPFTQASSAAMNQQGMYQQGANQQGMNQQGGGATWQLNGALCSWSGSSNDYSSYSRTQKIVFDGQGNFQFGSESSFSSDAGLAYGGNPNVSTGTYNVGESIVTLHFSSGETYQVQINMRQDNGRITELMYDGTLYATGLCE